MEENIPEKTAKDPDDIRRLEEAIEQHLMSFNGPVDINQMAAALLAQKYLKSFIAKSDKSNPYYKGMSALSMLTPENIFLASLVYGICEETIKDGGRMYYRKYEEQDGEKTNQ